MRKLFILFFFFWTINAFAKTHHVNNTASGSNNGTSWINAFLNLQNAIDSARNGDTIKVAAGIYRPIGYNFYKFFELKNGVIFLAGYSPATGDTTDASRNWVNFPVILSADFLNGTSADSLVVAKNVSALTVMDGFFIKDARWLGLRILNSTNVFLRNIIVQSNSSDVVTIVNSSPSFRNCVFANNSGETIINEAGSHSSFYNCVVTGNTSRNINQPVIVNTNAATTFVNCTIVNNNGVVFNGVGSGSATIRNCIFWNNKNDGRIEECDIVSPSQSLQVSHSITQTYYGTSSINSLLISMNPRFLNILSPAGPDNKYFTSDDGLQLSIPCSPALNTGDTLQLLSFQCPRMIMASGSIPILFDQHSQLIH